jgi:hypothetical protein
MVLTASKGIGANIRDYFFNKKLTEGIRKREDVLFKFLK